MPFSLRNLKIRDQVLVLALPSFFILLSAVGLFLYVYWLVARTALLVQGMQQTAARAETLLDHVTEMSLGAQGYMLTRDPALLRAYEAANASRLQDVTILHDLELEDRSKASEVDMIQAAINDWQHRSVIPQIEKAKRGITAPDDVTLTNAQFLNIRDKLLKLIGQNRNAAAAEIRERGHVVRKALMIGAVLALLFIIALWFLVRAVAGLIARPVKQLIEASDRLSHGDFEPSLPPMIQNEFGVLSTSFHRMAQALRRDREELSALKRFAEAVTQCTSENEVYDHILHSLQERFRPNQVIIFRPRPEEDVLEAVATLVPLPENLRDWPVMEGKHSCKAVRVGRPFRVNDIAAEPLCPGGFVLPKEGSYYCGPLIAGGIIIGAVRLEAEQGFWTPERESLLESYLSSAASVLSNLRLLQTMREQANIDPLTKLYNRRFCEEYARKLMAMARRKNMPLGFIMMDLDHFKSFNDIYGHELGDRILRQFAKTVTQSMREANLTARFGGEEFVILLPDTGAEASKVAAERIRKAVSHMTVPSTTDKPLPKITVSLGIAVYPDHGSTLDEVLSACDRALYNSKRAGRNRTTVYVEETEITG